MGLLIHSYYTAFLWAALALTASISGLFIYNFISSPLKHFPGPFFATFTNVWRCIVTSGGSAHVTQANLHQRYGSAVRMGPNMLSLADPELIKTVYNFNDPWKKSRMYQVQESITPSGKGLPNLFSTPDEKWHGTVLKPIGTYFSASGINSLENYINNSINILIDELKTFVNTNRHCDIADYFLRFSWDAMSNVTFGTPLGFLQNTFKNPGKLLADADRDFDYFAMCSQLPELHYLLKANRIALKLRSPQLEWAVNLSFDHYQKRKLQKPHLLNKKRDFLDNYLEAQRKNPGLIDDGQMVSYLLTNTVAGSHPTAYTLTAIVYYVLRTPGVYSRLNRELDESQMKKTLPISWEAARKLQYMEAVVRETIRIHPAFALTLERVVPDEGLHLPDGRYVTGGTIVGMNPWVINQSEKLFGPQCGKFIPERWLPDPGEPAKEFEMRRKKMINSILSFGAGPRTCTGQHLAIMEIFKTTASFFVAFDVALACPDQEWKVTNSWTLRTENVPIVLRQREDAQVL